MLDTNAFNRALDAGVDPTVLSKHDTLYVTHIQLNELQATRESGRLAQLLRVFTAVEQEAVPTAAAVWNISEFNGAEFGSADGTYEAILESLNRRNGGKRNNPHDVLIGLTALKRRYVLVTDDTALGDVMREFGGTAITFAEFVDIAR